MVINLLELRYDAQHKKRYNIRKPLFQRIKVLLT